MVVPFTAMVIMGQLLVEARMIYIFPTTVAPQMATPILATPTFHQMGMGMEAGKLEIS